MPKKYTPRGFRVYTEFTDTYGARATVQMSSAIQKRCWIYVHDKSDDAALGEERKRPEFWRNGDAALHLDVKQARRIVKALQAFIGDE